MCLRVRLHAASLTSSQCPLAHSSDLLWVLMIGNSFAEKLIGPCMLFLIPWYANPFVSSLVSDALPHWLTVESSNVVLIHADANAAF